jgi:hypothetical protein
MEMVVGRRERQRNAALLFGEVLSTLQIIIELGAETRGRGDPYGPITMRLLRAARREIDVYERNRERLYDLTEGSLRARIHTLMVRIGMPLEGVFDATRELADVQARLAAAAIGSEDAKARTAMLNEQRDNGFNFLAETGDQLKPLIAELEPLARHSFQGLGAIARG